MLLGVIVAAVMVLFAYGDGTRHEWLYFFSAGVLAGFTLFVKFGGFLPLAFILLSYAVIYMKARNVVSFCMGAGIAILLYQLMLPAGVGLVQLIGNYSALQTSLSVTTLLNNVIALLYYFFGLVPSTNLQLSGLGLIGVFAIIGIYIAFTRKDKPLEFASVSFISVLLYLFFGTQSLTHYILITVVTRYFIWFSPLLVLLTAEFFNEFRDRKDAYRIFVILLFMLLLSNLLLYVFLLWGADIVYLVTQMIQIRVLFH
jgi:hypothetical protein